MPLRRKGNSILNKASRTLKELHAGMVERNNIDRIEKIVQRDRKIKSKTNPISLTSEEKKRIKDYINRVAEHGPSKAGDYEGGFKKRKKKSTKKKGFRKNRLYTKKRVKKKRRTKRVR